MIGSFSPAVFADTITQRTKIYCGQEVKGKESERQSGIAESGVLKWPNSAGNCAGQLEFGGEIWNLQFLIHDGHAACVYVARGYALYCDPVEKGIPAEKNIKSGELNSPKGKPIDRREAKGQRGVG
ncbi:MAG: hypothetical protein C5B49_15775 [Bdellovibrio sp.]|nr:MAG: hypothetical protein C5B49_15775 [Bdellovibrio sp.]